MIEGAGVEPNRVFGSLKGNGTIMVEKPVHRSQSAVFEALTCGRSRDPADTKQIRNLLDAFFQRQLKVARRRVPSHLLVDRPRLLPRVEANGADLAVTATLNLADAGLDATLALSGATTAGVAGRPAVSVTLKGPLAAPRSTFNADTLAGWLALRSVEQQSKRLEIIEMTRRAAIGQAPLVLSAVPAAPSAEENDANPTTTQAVTPEPPTQTPTDANPAPDQAPAQTAVESNPITADTANPITADTTGGVLGEIQVPPPLPPAITVETPVGLAPPESTTTTRTPRARGALSTPCADRARKIFARC
jgi:hypothetical protein